MILKNKIKKPSNLLKQEIAWLKRDCPDCGEKDLARLGRGEPLDYVIGWRDFLGCRIDLSAKPLIPRAETEFWVESAIKELGKPCEVAFSYAKNDFSHLPRKSRQTEEEVVLCATKSDFAPPLKVLDLFAGSGCIGLAVLKHCPNTHVTFGEKDPKLCAQIKKNLKINKIPASRAKVIPTNLFNPYFSISNLETLQKGGKLDQFDVILANPPYVPVSRSRVQKSVKDWEPKEALLAGNDGLAVIKKFLKQAKSHLKPNGPSTSLDETRDKSLRASKIYLEFGYGQKLAINRLLKQFGYTNWQFHQDQFGKWRWVVIE